MLNPRLVVFDINHTIVEENTWAKMNLALGMTEQEDAVLWGLNQEGILTNDLWVSIVNSLYQKRGKATYETIRDVVLDYTYVDGAKECVAALQDAGVQVALLSGSVDMMVRQVATDLNIEIFKASAQLFFNPDGSLAKMTYLDEDAKAKVYDLVAICKEAGVTMDEVVCVGDGANERELFKLTRGITFEDSKLSDIAWKVVPSIKEVASTILTDTNVR